MNTSWLTNIDPTDFCTKEFKNHRDDYQDIFLKRFKPQACQQGLEMQLQGKSIEDLVAAIKL